MPGSVEGEERGVSLYGGHDDRKRRDENEDGLKRSEIPDDGENILIMKYIIMMQCISEVSNLHAMKLFKFHSYY